MSLSLRILATLSIALASCAFDIEPCDSDEDCPVGTACARPAGTDVPMCLSKGNAGGSTPDAGDAGGSPNIIPWPDTGDPTIDGECPAVRNCGAMEPNDTEDDAILLSESTVGCGGSGVDAWSVLHQDNVCAGDVDQFTIEYLACRVGSFKLAVSLTTPEACPPGDMLEIEEGLYDCQDRNVRCEVVENAERITLIIGPQDFPQPVERIRFAVRAAADAGTSYILRATVSR